jgi:hypothetical protein
VTPRPGHIFGIFTLDVEFPFIFLTTTLSIAAKVLCAVLEDGDPISLVDPKQYQVRDLNIVPIQHHHVTITGMPDPADSPSRARTALSGANRFEK